MVFDSLVFVDSYRISQTTNDKKADIEKFVDNVQAVLLWDSPVFTHVEKWISNTQSFPHFVLIQQVSQWILSWMFSFSFVGLMDCLEFKYYIGC